MILTFPPITLTFLCSLTIDLKYALPGTRIQDHDSIKSEVSIAISFRVNHRHRQADRRTDIRTGGWGATLNAASWSLEGSIITATHTRQWQ